MHQGLVQGLDQGHAGSGPGKKATVMQGQG